MLYNSCMKKICIRCKESKLWNFDFQNCRKNEDGFDKVCRECRSIEKETQHKKSWFKNTSRLKKNESKKKGIPFDLDGKYLESIYTGKCSVFKVDLIKHEKGHDNCPALDRKIPEKGYVKGNVEYISARANRIKYNATVEELEKVLEYTKKCNDYPERE